MKGLINIITIIILIVGISLTLLSCKVTETLTSPVSTEQLNTVSDLSGSINVYFNKNALTRYATANNKANHRINLETRLLHRINAAQNSIDMALYEINLEKIVNALIDRAANGVTVRVIADAKADTDAEHNARYTTMRLYLEKMVRGQDGVLNTQDDIFLFSDSPIFAVTDSTQRLAMGLSSSLTDIPSMTVTVGSRTITDHLLVNAEQKSNGRYYSPNPQMHNKFVVIDNKWVWTGSWNFTITGLYGTEANQQNNVLDGNTQHSVELHSPELADIFRAEFNEMWGSNSTTSDTQQANFHGRKFDNTLHEVMVGGRKVNVYFSPGDDALGHVTNYVNNHAHHSAYFTIFAWSDQGLADTLKEKWESSRIDNEGTVTGFDVKGVFDSSFWNQWWSASIEMTGRTGSRTSTNNPNTRWKNLAPVFRDNETRKLHSKTMLIDVCTASEPAVIVGSTNWSANGNNVNDENLLLIHDAAITNQFLQAFTARYEKAGGVLDTTIPCQ